MTPPHVSWSICVHFIPNKCFQSSNSSSSRLLLNSLMISQLRSSDHWSQRWSSWRLWSWPEGVKTSFGWTKCMWQGYCAKKMDQIAHFWPEWWFKLFTSAYRGSPPPAVFQNKYQSYKYERNTAGKSANQALPVAYSRYQLPCFFICLNHDAVCITVKFTASCFY